MNLIDSFLVGVAPEHVAALLAALLLLPVVVLLRRIGRRPARTDPYRSDEPTGVVIGIAPINRPRSAPTTVDRWLAWLLGLSAVIHLALPLGHLDGVVLTVGFLASGAAYAWLAVRAHEGRPRRVWSALLLAATLITYAVVVVTGREEADQVGLVTALIELAALGLCLVPPRPVARRRRLARAAGSVATMASVVVVGVVLWAGSFAAHADTSTAAGASDLPPGHDHSHGHTHAARAQAGVVMRPSAQTPATADQKAAAERLATATRDGTRRFAHLDVALAAGYRLPKVAEGTAVHLENKAYQSDGRMLDPERPETLVYAIKGGRATLLGALYVMERAGVPGPDIGPITHWHAHNVCLTLTPPGFGVVSPFGSCPALSVTVTSAEMMHVWVIDNPGGWFAESLPDSFVTAYHAQHGVPFTAR